MGGGWGGREGGAEGAGFQGRTIQLTLRKISRCFSLRRDTSMLQNTILDGTGGGEMLRARCEFRRLTRPLRASTVARDGQSAGFYTPHRWRAIIKECHGTRRRFDSWNRRDLSGRVYVSRRLSDAVSESEQIHPGLIYHEPDSKYFSHWTQLWFDLAADWGVVSPGSWFQSHSI